MKRIVTAVFLCLLYVRAQTIQMTSEEIENWHIELETPQTVRTVPLGDYVATVTAPPSRYQTISLPFEAQVKRVNVALYDPVNKGEILAEVTGTEWISVQREAISEAIELRHHKHLTERKLRLCEAEVIPKKECIAAQAELEADKIRLQASKALLKSYGASDETIARLLETLRLSPTLPVRSLHRGHIVAMQAGIGESISPEQALFVILTPGENWLSLSYEASKCARFEEGDKMYVQIGKKRYETVLLRIAPVIEKTTRTRLIRLRAPKTETLTPGARLSISLYRIERTLKVPKNAVVNYEKKRIVFVKNDRGFEVVKIDVLAEDETHYYLRYEPSVASEKIAVSATAVLKNMIGGNDE